MGGLVGQRKGRIGCLGRRRRRVGRKGWIGCLGRSSRACCFGRSCRATDGGAPSGSGGLAGRRMDGPGRLFRVVTSGLLFRAVVSGGEWEGTSGSGRTGLAVSGGRVGWRRMGWAGRLFRAVVPGGCLGWSRLACCFERSWRACCSVRSCRVANGRARRAAEGPDWLFRAVVSGGGGGLAGRLSRVVEPGLLLRAVASGAEACRTEDVESGGEGAG